MNKLKKLIGSLVIFILSSVFFIINGNPFTYLVVVVSGIMSVYYYIFKNK